MIWLSVEDGLLLVQGVRLVCQGSGQNQECALVAYAWDQHGNMGKFTIGTFKDYDAASKALEDLYWRVGRETMVYGRPRGQTK